MEVNSQTLTTLLKGMVSKSLRDWDTKLSHVAFAIIGLLLMLLLIVLMRYAMASTLSLLLMLSPFLKSPR